MLKYENTYNGYGRQPNTVRSPIHASNVKPRHPRCLCRVRRLLAARIMPSNALFTVALFREVPNSYARQFENVHVGREDGIRFTFALAIGVLAVARA